MTHACRKTIHNPHGLQGAAIDRCQERFDGTFWVDNDEYSTPVDFCPFCGEKAKTPAPIDPGHEEENGLFCVDACRADIFVARAMGRRG